MASTHTPRGSTQKKVLTYGKSSRPRQLNNSEPSSEPKFGISRRSDSLKNDAPTSALPDRSTTNPVENRTSVSRVHHAQAGGSVSRTGIVSGDSNESDIRKRKRSVGFALDDDGHGRPTKASPSLITTSSLSDQRQRQQTSPSKPRSSQLSSKTTFMSQNSTPDVGMEHRKVSLSTTEVPLNSTAKPGPDNLSTHTIRHRRPRLIDRLAAQKPESSESEDDSESKDGRVTNRHASLVQAVPESPSHRASAPERDIWRPTNTTQTRTPTGKKIRHTYSQGRSMLDDSNPLDDNLGLPGNAHHDMLLADPPIKSHSGAFDFPGSESDPGEDSDDQKMAIKSVHELRRAGANNRFSDEMEDLLSRIGTPSRQSSSLRRNALLELAHKMQQGDFAAQFRDHATRDNFVKRVGDEEDVIGGFAMAATLIIFLSSKDAPHLLQRLVEERVGRLLKRLLHVTEDVDDISSKKSANLSKVGRRSLNGVKSYLLRLPIWFGREEDDMSPRIAGLQLLSILFRHIETRYRLEVMRDLGEELRTVVDDQTQTGTEEDVEYALVMVILEAQSGLAATLSDSPEVSWQTSKNAIFLQRVLNKWPEGHDDIESAVLKLAINTTNTEPGAKVFGHQSLLQCLVHCTRDGIHRVQEAVRNDQLQDNIYDGLLLILGVLINILEQYPPARTTMDDRSLDVLVTLYLENHESLGDADSELKSKVSVAFGYVAVILGYLALGQPARVAIQNRTDGTGIRNLVRSIREFIGLYRSVDSKVHELEGLVGELQRQGR